MSWENGIEVTKWVFVDESKHRVYVLAAVSRDAGITAHIYVDHQHREDLAARSACLKELVQSNAGWSSHIVIEQDDGLVGRDRADLYRYVHQAGQSDSISYEHRRASAELLLGLADAVAWAWAKGGDWRRRIRPAVVVHRVLP